MKFFIFLSSSALAADICWDKVGCFTDDPPFSVPGYRPRRLPSSPAQCIDHMRLTNQKVKDQNVDWTDPIRRTSFDLGEKVVVWTHGWNDFDSGSPTKAVGKWLAQARDSFQSKTSVNFIAVDWRHCSQQLDYPQAAADTQSVGRAIAYMFNELKTKSGFRDAQFECSGHSLGAHVCSYAAKYAKKEFNIQLNRVTGMDAAGPLFEKAATEVRIDATDATFVDLLHCNGGDEGDGFLGINAPIGHADFYINGGRNQPGCSNLNDNGFICSHNKCMQYVIDSVDQGPYAGCSFPVCTHKDYDNGKCDTCQSGSPAECNNLGYYAQKPEVTKVYYGNTGEDKPFCK